MKIGGYNFLQNSGEQMSSLDKKAPEGKRSVTPLDLEKIIEHRQKLNSSESKRAQVQTYLEDIKESRQELFVLQQEEEILEKAQQNLHAALDTLSDDKDYLGQVQAKTLETRSELDHYSQEKEELRPELAASLNELESLLQSSSEEAVDLDAVKSSLDNIQGHLNKARNDISSEKDALQENIASIMVAMENITASQSLIRDEEGANQAMEELKDSITSNVSQSMLSQANLHRDYIMRLIG